MENREIFLHAGGERYEYIPCLNDQAAHIEMLAGLVERHIQGWSPGDEDPQEVLERAGRQGAEH